MSKYSTSEVLTGDTWIDGKPIYRQVFHITTLGSWVNTQTNVDTLISNSGVGIASTYKVTEYYIAASDFFSVGAITSAGKISLIAKAPSGANYTDVYITVEYTKP